MLTHETQTAYKLIQKHYNLKSTIPGFDPSFSINYRVGHRVLEKRSLHIPANLHK